MRSPGNGRINKHIERIIAASCSVHMHKYKVESKWLTHRQAQHGLTDTPKYEWQIKRFSNKKKRTQPNEGTQKPISSSLVAMSFGVCVCNENGGYLCIFDPLNIHSHLYYLHHLHLCSLVLKMCRSFLLLFLSAQSVCATFRLGWAIRRVCSVVEYNAST